jgi:hypothetical protein
MRIGCWEHYSSKVKGKSRANEYYQLKMEFPNLRSQSQAMEFTGSLEVKTSWTYWTIQRPDGTSHSEGQGIIMTKDGSEVATATGRGEGKMTESGKMRYVSALFYEINSKNKLSFLDHLIGVNEYEVDASGNYEHRLWEWK